MVYGEKEKQASERKDKKIKLKNQLKKVLKKKWPTIFSNVVFKDNVTLTVIPSFCYKLTQINSLLFQMICKEKYVYSPNMGKDYIRHQFFFIISSSLIGDLFKVPTVITVQYYCTVQQILWTVYCRIKMKLYITLYIYCIIPN